MIINKDILLSAINKAGSAIKRNPTLPIIENVVIKTANNELTVIGTDLEITVKAMYAIQDDATLSACVNYTDIKNFLSALPHDSVDISVKEDILILEYGFGDMFEIPSDDVSQFPETPEIGNGDIIKLDGIEFNSGLKRTKHFSGNDQLRPVLTGTYIEIDNDFVRTTATDAHVMITSKYQHNSTGKAESFIIPSRAIDMLNTMTGDIECLVTRTNVIFTDNNLKVIVRTIDGTFPNYRAVIPSIEDEKTSITFDAKDLLKGIKVISAAKNRATNTAILSINGDKLRIEAEDIDNRKKASYSIGISEFIGDKEEYRAGFNTNNLEKVLTEWIKKYPDTECILATPVVKAPFNKAAIIGDGESILILIMPVMI